MSFLERMLSRSRLRDARQKLARDPSSYNYAALAEEHARSGDMESVQQVCEEGLELYPEDPALVRLITRSRKLTQEGRMRELAREIREAPRSALYREMCDLLLEARGYRRAEEIAAEWYRQCDDPSALLTQARACGERFFVDRGREEGRRAWELLDRFEQEADAEELGLRLRARLAAAVGSWGDAIRAVMQLLEIHPGDQPLEARFRALSTMPGGVTSFELGLRELEKTGRFADEDHPDETEQDSGSATTVRPLLKELGSSEGVQAVLFTRGSTALVQGLKGATAERTARAVREVVHVSRTTARRLGIGQGLEVQLEGDFGALLVSSGEDGSAALWHTGPNNEAFQRGLSALVRRAQMASDLGEERVKEVLEPLSAIPGVRVAVLVTSDGVPVVVRGRASEHSAEDGIEEAAESLAALASGWLNALTRAVAPLSWTAPERVVLKATRGTIVMLQAPGSVLLALLDGGARPEDLRLPMQGAVVRIQRLLRWSQQGSQAEAPGQPAQAPLPTRDMNPDQGPAPDPTDNSRTPIHRDQPG